MSLLYPGFMDKWLSYKNRKVDSKSARVGYFRINQSSLILFPGAVYFLKSLINSNDQLRSIIHY
jgi:hypothetical protein